MREQRSPASNHYSEPYAWTARPTQKNWGYTVPPPGAYMRVNPPISYTDYNANYRANSQRTPNMTSLRQGPMQQPVYQELTMARQQLPLRPPRSEVEEPSCKPSTAPKQPDKLFSPVLKDDNPNKLSPVVPKKPPQQLLKPTAQLTSDKSSVQYLVSNLPFLKDSATAPSKDTAKPDFDSVLASAAQPPAAASPDQLSSTHSESLTSSSPHESSELFNCPVPNCTKQYLRKCRVLEHIRRGHYREGAPMFKCPDTGCDRTFDSLEGYKCHQRNEGHSKHYIILFNTEKKSDRPAEPVRKRMMTEDGNSAAKYQCTSCEKSYSNKYRRDAHAAVCNGNGNKAFACSYPGCGKAYATKDSLTRHFRVFSHGETDQGTKDGGDSEKKEAKQTQSAEKNKEEERPGYRDRVQELVDLFDEI